VDPAAKTKLLRAVPTGLYVIGLKAGDELHGFTASWLTQVSLNPPCVMLGVRAGTRSYEMIRAGRVFTVNFIRREHKSTIEHFFKPVSQNGGRLGNFSFRIEKTGAPVLDEAIGFLECEVRTVADGFGDHAAVIGEVVNAAVREDVPPIVMADTPWHYGG
jgi:flavin reductase (DIM6/NTAB) family NADH-FMN oxidoreductase RutF